MVLPKAAMPSKMLSVADFLSEPFPGDTRLFSCPQRQIFCLFVLCLWPLGTVCFYDFITAGRADDLFEAQSAWFLHQWPLQATGMENKKYFEIKCVIGTFESVLSQEISHILLSQGSQGCFGGVVVTFLPWLLTQGMGYKGFTIFEISRRVNLQVFVLKFLQLLLAVLYIVL